jgi:hypothetical protein
MEPELEMQPEKSYIRYEKMKGIGLFLMGVATAILSMSVILLLRQNDSLLHQNSELDIRLECRSDVRDELDVAIGRGLVAVANDDSAALKAQAEIIIQVSERVGDC